MPSTFSPRTSHASLPHAHGLCTAIRHTRGIRPLALLQGHQHAFVKKGAVMAAQQVLATGDLIFQPNYLRAKRVLDIVLTLLALIPASLIMLVIAIAIWVDSPGPVIFKQKRVGMNGV